MDIVVEDYTEKSIVVHGADTKKYKDKLLELMGKFNGRLQKNGKVFAGWIFPKTRKQQVLSFVNSLTGSSSPESDNIVSTSPTTSKISKLVTEIRLMSSSLSSDQKLSFLFQVVEALNSRVQVTSVNVTRSAIKTDSNDSNEIEVKKVIKTESDTKNSHKNSTDDEDNDEEEDEEEDSDVNTPVPKTKKLLLKP